MKKAWNKLVFPFGLILSGVCLWLAFKGVSLVELRQAFGNLNYHSLMMAYILAITGCVLRALQWHLVLRSKRRVTIARLFSSIMIGFFFNFVLPARLGEIVRARVISSKEKIGFTTVFTTVAITRILDGLALLALLAYVFLFSGLLTQINASQNLLASIRYATYFLGSVCVTVLMLCIAVALFQRQSYELAEQAGRWFANTLSARWHPVDSVVQRSLRLLKEFIEGLHIFRHHRDLLGAVAASLAVWILGGLTTQSVLLAFGVELPLSASFFVMVMVALGIALPGAPGYIGQFHAACRYALVPFAVPPATAASIATGLHALHFTYSVMIGGICLIGEGISWTYLRETGIRLKKHQKIQPVKTGGKNV